MERQNEKLRLKRRREEKARASLVGDPEISDFLPPLEEDSLLLRDKQASAKPATRHGAQVLTRTRILTPLPKKSFHKRCCSFAGRCMGGEGIKW